MVRLRSRDGADRGEGIVGLDVSVGIGEDKALDGGDALILDIVDQVSTGVMACGAYAGGGAGVMDGDGALGSVEGVAVAGVFVAV